MPKGIVIPADSTAPPGFRDFDSLADYETVVGGPVRMFDVAGLGLTIVANSEASRRGLPINHNATWLWWYGAPALLRQTVLLGDVAVVGEPDPDGELTNIPASFAGDVLHAHGHGVKLKVTDEKGWNRTEVIANNYFDAIILAFDLLDRWPGAEVARVVPRPPQDE